MDTKTPTPRTDELANCLDHVSANAAYREMREHAEKLEQELDQATTCCAELITDGNAISLAVSLANKSVECERYRLVTLKQDMEIARLNAMLSGRSEANLDVLP